MKLEGLHFIEVRNTHEVQCICGRPGSQWSGARVKWGDFEDDSPCMACAASICDAMSPGESGASGEAWRENHVSTVSGASV